VSAVAARAGGEPVAVVTGGNRGIGFEICRQLAALASCSPRATRKRARRR
jgi:NAD(P)-dependent dehydrogenase (short-subunit alcohol dehydrogenase family)